MIMQYLICFACDKYSLIISFFMCQMPLKGAYIFSYLQIDSYLVS